VTLTGAPANLSAFAFYVTNAPNWPLPAVAPAGAQAHLNCFVDDFSNGVHRVTAFVLGEPPIQNGGVLMLTYAVPPDATQAVYPLTFPPAPATGPNGPNPEARTLVENESIAAAAQPGSILVMGPRPYIVALRKLNDGVLQFRLEAGVGTNYVVLASTNVAAPVAEWEVLGQPALSAPGVYEFADPATNAPHRFYLLKER
jgi:hypothetical protein